VCRPIEIGLRRYGFSVAYKDKIIEKWVTFGRSGLNVDLPEPFLSEVPFVIQL
jgi:hypothetical protein